MLELKLNSKAPHVARQWLDEEVGNAIAGLIPTAAGRGKLAEAALDYLREKRRQGHEDLIRRCSKDHPKEITDKIRSEVLDRAEKIFPAMDEKTTPAWLKKQLGNADNFDGTPLPAWLVLDRLAPVVVENRSLQGEKLVALLLALRKSNWEHPVPLIEAVKQHGDAQSLSAFAWSLFELWLEQGGPAKEKWAMSGLGFFGDDRLALKLTPLVRAWPGESQHQRAVMGLECLRAIGTDTALMQLNGIANKLKYPALKNKAGEFMEAIAQAKGLTADELEDRIVPDCDLDERGTRMFDFGPRQFRLVLGPDMKPMVKDEANAVKADLPKPGAKDDAAKAEAAIQEWKLAKKQVGQVAKIQAVRLEQSMGSRRRWPVADFETLLVKHPLMINLVRMLLWAGYDKKGNRKMTFRVTEEQTYANAADEPCDFEGIDAIGLVHVLELTEKEKSAWGEIFSDYEIVPPFAQLGRQTFELTDEELKGDEITRFRGIKVPANTFVFGLEKQGWVRGQAQDNGIVNGHSRFFPSANLSAVAIYDDGIPVSNREGWQDQAIEHLYFVPGNHRVTWGRRWKSKDPVLKLSKIDPLIVSEVLSDVTALTEKGK